MTELFVVSGAGGVGKTTSSAALALAIARTGRRTLLVTVDPARRLADVVEQSLGDTITPHHAEPMLSLWMPNTSTEMSRIAKDTMTPRAHPIFEANRVTKLFHAAPAGLHEAVCALSLGQLAPCYDVVVVDTAPFEQSGSFMKAPAQLRRLLEGKAIALFSAFGSGRGIGQRVVERMLDRVMPAEIIAEGAEFFRTILTVRHELARRAACAEVLLATARHVVVAAPHQAGVQSALMLRRSLDTESRRSPSCRKTLTIVNRAAVDVGAGMASPATQQALRLLPGACILPVLEGSSREIVDKLSFKLESVVSLDAPTGGRVAAVG